MPHYDDYDDRIRDRRYSRNRHDDYDRYDLRRFDDAPLPHSGFGIAAFIMAILVGVFEVLLIVVATVLAGDADWDFDDPPPEQVLLGLGMIGGMGLAVIAIILAVIGLCLPGRNRLFAILGLVLAGLILVGMCGVIALGTALSGM
jgi:hypothetical protein